MLPIMEIFVCILAVQVLNLLAFAWLDRLSLVCYCGSRPPLETASRLPSGDQAGASTCLSRSNSSAGLLAMVSQILSVRFSHLARYGGDSHPELAMKYPAGDTAMASVVPAVKLGSGLPSDTVQTCIDRLSAPSLPAGSSIARRLVTRAASPGQIRGSGALVFGPTSSLYLHLTQEAAAPGVVLVASGLEHGSRRRLVPLSTSAFAQKVGQDAAAILVSEVASPSEQAPRSCWVLGQPAVSAEHAGTNVHAGPALAVVASLVAGRQFLPHDQDLRGEVRESIVPQLIGQLATDLSVPGIALLAQRDLLQCLFEVHVLDLDAIYLFECVNSVRLVVSFSHIAGGGQEGRESDRCYS